MRCKKHIQDLTSTVGVCASCLRERLQALLDAEIQSSSFIDRVLSDDHRRHRKPDRNPPQPPQPQPEPNFPRSVSPYVNRRNEHLFRTTPQLDPAVSAACDGRPVSTKRKLGRFWILSNIFRSRSNKTDSSSGESYAPSSATTAATPPSSTWYSAIITERQQNHVSNDRRKCRISDRGASPVDYTPENFVNEIDGRDRLDSGCSMESSPQRTHRTTTVAAATRRSRLGPAGKSLTSMALCLSPLVRASPNRLWNSHKGLTQELGVSGAHHISTTTTTTFCSNRSRKLADFGRLGYNR